MVFYTIVDSEKYLNDEEFTWGKMMEIINRKLYPHYMVSQGAFVDDINSFINEYDVEPVFISVDNGKKLSTGQVFTLVDMVNSKQRYSPIFTSEQVSPKETPILPEIRTIGADFTSYGGENYANNRYTRSRRGQI